MRSAITTLLGFLLGALLLSACQQTPTTCTTLAEALPQRVSWMHPAQPLGKTLYTIHRNYGACVRALLDTPQQRSTVHVYATSITLENLLYWIALDAQTQLGRTETTILLGDAMRLIKSGATSCVDPSDPTLQFMDEPENAVQFLEIGLAGEFQPTTGGNAHLLGVILDQMEQQVGRPVRVLDTALRTRLLADINLKTHMQDILKAICLKLNLQFDLRAEGILLLPRKPGEALLDCFASYRDPRQRARHLWNRGVALQNQQQYAASRTLQEQAIAYARQSGDKILLARFLNHLAWMLSTCLSEADRDGEAAVELAREARLLVGDPTEGAHAGLVADIEDTLAAAHAERDAFDLAIAHQSKALEWVKAMPKVPPIKVQQFEDRLKMYKSAIPHRE